MMPRQGRGRWLRYWLAQAEPHLRASTLHGYCDHIDRYLIPSLGRVTLAGLTGKRPQACFDLLARQRTRNGAPIAASTIDRVRATLRSALNAAVREGLIAANPLAQVRLAKPVRPRARCLVRLGGSAAASQAVKQPALVVAWRGGYR